jgi:spermidine synthase
VTVLVVEPVAYWCLQFRLAVGSLLASAFLFFLPLALLAMVGPFFVRVLTVSVTGVGGNVGRLTAISTVGSVVGTVLIGYVLIPFLPNSMTMYLTAAALLAVAAAYFAVWTRKALPGTLVAAALGLAMGWAGASPPRKPHYGDMEEIVRRNSNFGLLQVLQASDGGRRSYLNDYLTQNVYDAREKKSLTLFTYMLHDLAVAYSPRVEDVLCIGLGVGIVPMQFAREGAKVDVVEINPAVVPLGKQYFDCEPERLNVILGDGRYYVNRSAKQYDALLLDAFLGDSSPSHLFSKEAFTSMRRILRPTGVLVINCFGDLEAGKDFFVASVQKTLRTVFASVRIHNDGHGGNVFVVASMQPDLKPGREPNLDTVHPYVRQSVRATFASLVETHPDHGMVLTDDHNPLEFYDAANRESLRRYWAVAMRAR